MTATRPLLVFDVNETLTDLTALHAFFDARFDQAGVMREWFANLVLYSQTATLAGRYLPFGQLAQRVLRMLGDAHGVALDESDEQALAEAIGGLEAHPEVDGGLARLRAAGFRLVSLTNSAPGPDGADALTRSGLAHHFEQRLSVDEIQCFKPAAATYRLVERRLDVDPGDCWMIAAHVWDTIGAQAAGWRGAFITRRGNALLDSEALPRPDLVGRDLAEVAEALIEHYRD